MNELIEGFPRCFQDEGAVLCILRIDPYGLGYNAVKGWVMASDMHSARRQVVDDPELQNILYHQEFTPPPGRYLLNTATADYLVVVS